MESGGPEEIYGRAEGGAGGKASGAEKTNNKCGRADGRKSQRQRRKQTINARRVDERKAGGARQSEFHCGRVGSGRAACGVGIGRNGVLSNKYCFSVCLQFILGRY